MLDVSAIHHSPVIQLEVDRDHTFGSMTKFPSSKMGHIRKNEASGRVVKGREASYELWAFLEVSGRF